ncbi:HD domain-containing phosphohydrolase [Limisalsivibrio acetivorans]|uniref:HD domain-containing phosphohydrolase n=1 Tax=Limisalsivibrio acetivorans TaxID=1304888 RepID=UPI000409233A|nr:HD domain-containing phosphohydrolase [Limisalsivibrio acetivorans]
MFKSIPIRISIIMNFIAVAVIGVLLVMTVQYYYSNKMAISATEDHFATISEDIKQGIMGFDERTSAVVNYLEVHPDIAVPPDTERKHPLTASFTRMLENMPDLYALYTGHSDGSFFEIVNLEIGNNIRSTFLAPENARWCIIMIPGGTGLKYTYFLDDAKKLIRSRIEETEYNPVNRPWYRSAIESDKTIRTEPYVFSNLKKAGVTYAKHISGKDVVLAADVSLHSLSSILESEKVYEQTGIFLLDSSNEFIAAAGGSDINLFNEYSEDLLSEGRGVLKADVNGVEYLVETTPVTDGFWESAKIVIAVPYSVMAGPYIRIITISFMVTLLLSVIIIPLIMFSSYIIVRPLRELMGENELVSKREFSKVKGIKTIIKEYQELSTSLVHMSGDIEAYQKAQQELFDSFIKLIAEAVDNKSKYTGGHCRRVPVLTEMLAKAASDSKQGALKDFTLKSEDDWRELYIGAWLHDCGKLVIPDHIMDKSVKLETIYNRIHEIRTRFEVLLRDKEIEACERIINGEERDEVNKWLDGEKDKLKKDFEFTAFLNNGDHFVTDDDLERLRQIAERTWKPYFDRTAGLSFEEDKQLKESGDLPQEENVLMDAPFHVSARSDDDTKDFEALGFKVDVPQNLYNKGELYNLSTQRGTLTEEERYKINEHMIMSIRMLEELPFPQNLSNVPEYAGAHHETMDGTGYPRRLTRDEMSVPARIMAVADIFEALTAADRPYKAPKKLSESVKILSFMAKEDKIDSEIFELFLTSGIYREYAEKTLKPEQIDEVDVQQYISGGES